MALILEDRVRETTTVTGTGTATLLGAVTGYRAFSVIGNANTTYYCISSAGAEFEIGIGTYTSSGTTLARTIVLASSNAGALVNFSAGTKDVFVTYPSYASVSQVDIGSAPNQIPLNQYLGNLAYQDAANIAGDLRAGSINNTPIGATTSSTGAFSTLSATGVTTVQAGTDALPAITPTGDPNTGIFFPAADQVGIATNGVERVEFGNTETVFNDGGLNLDFRVEGDTDANLLFVDASADAIGIGTASPNASALLDVQSTTKGVRMPNMTTTQKNAIVSPAAGLMVFDTTLSKLSVYSGLAWETITSL
jgi:hypothetical protein